MTKSSLLWWATRRTWLRRERSQPRWAPVSSSLPHCKHQNMPLDTKGLLGTPKVRSLIAQRCIYGQFLGA